jgi:hypothetical protein
MVALSYNPPVLYQHRAHQRVRVGVAAASFCELEGSLNKSLV